MENNNIITINGVRAYEDNGVAYINLEDAARGLGFTQAKKGAEYIRWETVMSYLNETGFSQQVGKGDFIPENIFFRLAMKAKNEVAVAFQKKVADEILPSIRKTGGYVDENREAEFISIYFPSFSEEVKLAMVQDLHKQNYALKNQNSALEKQNRALVEENDMLANGIRTWGSRKVLNALIRAIAAKTNTEFGTVWNDFYRQLELGTKIGLKKRMAAYSGKGKKRPLDFVHDEDEWAEMTKLAAAMARSEGIEIAKVINEVNAEKIA